MVDMGTKRLKMGVADRLNALGMLPEKGGLVTLRIAKDARKKIGLSQQEIKDYGIVEEAGGRVRWNDDAPSKEIVFTEAEYKMLRDAVDKLDQENKISPHTLETCELILGNRVEEEKDDEEKEPDQS